MQRLVWLISIFWLITISASVPLHALQISQIEFDLHLTPGSTGNYSFLVINDEAQPQKITVYLNDWVRTPQGETDFFPLNDARWLFPRKFAPGDKVTVIYRVRPPFAGVTIAGSYATGSPTVYGKISGPAALSAPVTGQQPSLVPGPVQITRTITPSPTVSGALRVQLTIEAFSEFAGLRIDEVFSHHVTVESVDNAGGVFNTVARSDGDWITVSPTEFTIAQGKTQEVTFTVHVPATGVSGTYWGAILIQGSPREVKRQGTTVLAVERFGVKVYVTITGTEVRAGRVIGIREIALKPLTFTVTFENTGNVQLQPTGAITIISQKGETMRTIPVEKFPVLPGAVQIITVKDPSSTPLPPGIYLARVAIDYGGEAMVGGQRAFRVK